MKIFTNSINKENFYNNFYSYIPKHTQNKMINQEGNSVKRITISMRKLLD